MPPTYGDPFGGSGTTQTGFGFTGEQTDASGLVYLRARYYVPGLGVFPSLDPVEEGNRYGYVGGNVANRVDPSGMLFWSFPSGNEGKDKLYDLSSYTGRNASGTCKKGFAHPWIEYWLEQNNGGLWATHIEFPGGGPKQRIDAVVLEGLKLQNTPPEHQGGVAAFVYEVEPLAPLIKVAEGFTELAGKFPNLRAGLSPYSHQGKLPKQDFWNPKRDMHIFAGAPYYWSGMTWQLAHQLSPQHGRGPTRVDPVQMGLSGLDDAYWVLLPVDGLVVYVSECELRDAGIKLVEAAILAYMLGRYLEARSRYNNNPKYPHLNPLPEAQIAYSVAPQELAPEAAIIASGALCLAGLLAITPWPDDVLIPLVLKLVAGY
ncbi:MAG: RHS repeat-associated core domain-containing protein [Anaerolinea sp.]|nr:RHS repeat-associated core domain-containing protein [Anaerolinea sp.]